MQTQLKTPYGKAKLYSASPEGQGSRGNIVVIPGFAETLTQNKRLVNSLAKQGYNASTYSQPRGRGSKEDRKRSPMVRAALIAGYIINKVDEPVDVVGHSMSAKVALIVAEAMPDKIGKVILLQPNGINSPQSLGQISKKSTMKNVDNLRNAGKIAASIGESKWSVIKLLVVGQAKATKLLAVNFNLAKAESIEAANDSLLSNAKKVRDLGKEVVVIGAQGDQFFDQQEVNATYGLAGHMNDGQTIAIDDLFPMSVMSNPEATHDASWMRPDETAIAIRAVLGHSALKAMNVHASQV